MPWKPKPLFLSTASLTSFLYFIVSALRRHLCAPMWYTMRLSDSLQYSFIFYVLHHCLLATFPQLKQILCPSAFWKLVVFLPSAESLNGQSSEVQYRFLMHLPTFLVPIRSFLLDKCTLKFLRWRLIWTYSCGEHLILYRSNLSISCGRSSTHCAAVLANKGVGNCNSLLLVLFWSESNCWEVLILESSVRSVTSSASSRLIGCSRVLGYGLSMVTCSSVWLSVGFLRSSMAHSGC